jgi:hypothetical protein
VSWSGSPRRFAAAHRCTMPWWTTSSDAGAEIAHLLNCGYA